MTTTTTLPEANEFHEFCKISTGPNEYHAESSQLLGLTKRLFGGWGRVRFAPGHWYFSASGGLSGQFSNIADSANTHGLSRVDIYGSNGLLVTYLPPAVGVINLSISEPLPALNPGNLNAFLLSVLDPNVEQLSAPFDIWFSLANTQRFNLETRFDDLIAGSTGFVSNVTYPTAPPTGKEVIEGQETKEPKEAPPPAAPGCRWGVWVTGYGEFVNVDNDGLAKRVQLQQRRGDGRCRLSCD